eukprot:CAMPEP_0174263584 /NCGR_PEP_ID=MMETSP0439-20130205/19287_1 /TAXON_ID=0 /ORGANISM="Stereomyxa ramosa, Strain Chinc5" /LENGTH=936 /DNA_ID=CAMNT_0015349005 /DNA_START=58 /DNA_END=2868 /DNA_ORIENTATION=+
MDKLKKEKKKNRKGTVKRLGSKKIPIHNETKRNSTFEKLREKVQTDSVNEVIQRLKAEEELLFELQEEVSFRSKMVEFLKAEITRKAQVEDQIQQQLQDAEGPPPLPNRLPEPPLNQEKNTTKRGRKKSISKGSLTSMKKKKSEDRARSISAVEQVAMNTELKNKFAKSEKPIKIKTPRCVEELDLITDNNNTNTLASKSVSLEALPPIPPLPKDYSPRPQKKISSSTSAIRVVRGRDDVRGITPIKRKSNPDSISDLVDHGLDIALSTPDIASDTCKAIINNATNTLHNDDSNNNPHDNQNNYNGPPDIRNNNDHNNTYRSNVNNTVDNSVDYRSTKSGSSELLRLTDEERANVRRGSVDNVNLNRTNVDSDNAFYRAASMSDEAVKVIQKRHELRNKSDSPRTKQNTISAPSKRQIPPLPPFQSSEFFPESFTCPARITKQRSADDLAKLKADVPFSSGRLQQGQGFGFVSSSIGIAQNTNNFSQAAYQVDRSLYHRPSIADLSDNGIWRSRSDNTLDKSFDEPFLMQPLSPHSPFQPSLPVIHEEPEFLERIESWWKETTNPETATVYEGGAAIENADDFQPYFTNYFQFDHTVLIGKNAVVGVIVIIIENKEGGHSRKKRVSIGGVYDVSKAISPMRQRPVHTKDPLKTFRVLIHSVKCRKQIFVRSKEGINSRLNAILVACKIQEILQPYISDTEFVNVNTSKGGKQKLVAFSNGFTELEQQLYISQYKFGVLYRKKGQNESEMFCNEQPSAKFLKFLHCLGTTIELQGWSEFRGGLDVKNGTTGQFSIFTTFFGWPIMFHVSTLLPFKTSDTQQIERKRHIGNDVVVIIFQDEADEFDPSIMKTHFNHIFIVVTMYSTEQIKLEVISRDCVKYFTPRLNHFFALDDKFREFLLVKMINGEHSALKSDNFAEKLQKTHSIILDNLYKQIID